MDALVDGTDLNDSEDFEESELGKVKVEDIVGF